MSTQTFTQRRALRAYNEAHREAIRQAERVAHVRQPEPANFCAPSDPDGREPFDWIDSAVFLCCGTVVALCLLIASWKGWLS